MAHDYDNLIKIASPWSGPRRLAGRPLVHGGEGYDDILGELSGEIVRTTAPGTRSSLAFPVINRTILGKLISQHVLDDPIEGKGVELVEVDHDSGVETVLFRGVVRKRDYSEQGVIVEAVEESISRSRRIGAYPVQEFLFPRARKDDIGSFIPVPIGLVEDAILPQVEWNQFTRLAETISRVDAQLMVEDAEGLPASGTLRIDDELVTYTLLDEANRLVQGVQRGQGGTKATGHVSGSVVVVVGDFVIAVDSSNRPSVVTEAYAVGDDDLRFPIDLPVMESRLNARVAVWPETPLFRQPLGQPDAIRVDIDSNNGTAPELNPQFAFGLMPLFTLRDYAALLFNGPTDLSGKRVEPAINRGNVARVLLEVLHSGTKTAGVSGFDSILGDVDVLLNGTSVGALVEDDVIDDLFLENDGRVEVFEGQADGQATGPQVVSDERREFGSVQLSNIASATFTNIENTGDEAFLLDGDDDTFALFDRSFSGPKTNELNFIDIQLPPSVPTDAALTRFRFNFLHGGAPNESFPGSGGTATIEVREGIALISAQTAFPVSDALTLRQLDSDTDASLASWLDNSGQGRTLAELQGLRCIITLFDRGVWQVRGAWVELDYEYDAVPEKHNPITNQFDISAVIGDWQDFEGATVSLIPDLVNTTLRVYRVSFQVVYEPVEIKVADKVLLTVQGDIAGTPAEIIQELWTDPELGNNDLSTLDVASVAAASARQSAEGYTADAVAGLIRTRELFAFILDFAGETRLRAFVDDGQLRLSYVEDKGVIGPAGVTVTKDDITEEPRFDGVDIERELVNVVTARYDRTDWKDFRRTKQRTEGASVSSFGEFESTNDFNFLKTEAAVDRTVDLLFERFSTPFDRVTLTLRRDFGRLSLLDFIRISLGWVDHALFEIETITEAFSDTFSVQGRVL